MVHPKQTAAISSRKFRSCRVSVADWAHDRRIFLQQIQEEGMPPESNLLAAEHGPNEIPVFAVKAVDLNQTKGNQTQDTRARDLYEVASIHSPHCDWYDWYVFVHLLVVAAVRSSQVLSLTFYIPQSMNFLHPPNNSWATSTPENTYPQWRPQWRSRGLSGNTGGHVYRTTSHPRYMTSKSRCMELPNVQIKRSYSHIMSYQYLDLPI